MAINLLELAQSYFTGPVTRQISGLLGESETVTQAAIGAAVPSLIGGLMKQASTPAGASVLSASLDKVDTSFLGNLGASLGAGSQKLMETGTGLVKNLFGGNLGSVSDLIGKASGMGKGAIGSLLGLVAPIVMGLLAKQKRTMGLDASGLTNLLSDQKHFISGVLPAGISDALDLGSVMGTAREVGRAAYDTGRAAVSTAGRAGAQAVRTGSSWAKTLLPILLIAALGLIAWRFFSSRGRSDVAQAATAQLDSAKRQIDGVLENTTAALTSIKDEASARAALPKLEEASRSVSALTSSLQAMPQSVRESVEEVVRNTLPSLRSLADKALAIPGVSSVLSPAVTQLMDALEMLQV